MHLEDLPRFVEAAVSGRGEYVNGVRLVYPMEERAMRFANLLGNKFFSLAFSWLLGQPIKDTLCGTKVLWREDYERIARTAPTLATSTRSGLRPHLRRRQRVAFVDVPIRYREGRMAPPTSSAGGTDGSCSACSRSPRAG